MISLMISSMFPIKNHRSKLMSVSKFSDSNHQWLESTMSLASRSTPKKIESYFTKTHFLEGSPSTQTLSKKHQTPDCWISNRRPPIYFFSELAKSNIRWTNLIVGNGKLAQKKLSFELQKNLTKDLFNEIILNCEDCF